MITRTALFCCASMVALWAGNPAHAAGKPVPIIAHDFRGIHRVISASPGSVTLYDQNDDANQQAVVSQNFTSGSTFSSYGADDFVIPSGHKWKIKAVYVTGTYWGGGPATSENVLFYGDDHGLPAGVVAHCDGVKGADNNGSFALKIPKTCKIGLKGGKSYWISMVINMDFGLGGQWGWETRNGQNGNAAAWENPDNGFETGCVTWEAVESCLGDFGQGPDFMFALKGKDMVR